MQSNEAMTEKASNFLEARWHALYTRHQHERLVAQALAGKGFDVFLPQYRAIHLWKDRRKELDLPLFPNYVFIQGGLDRMLNIMTTPGVHSLVAWGGRPADIPQREIDAVRRLIESPLRIEPYPFLNCGDRVRIKSGPLEGIEGILVRNKSAYRLVLSVEMLSRSNYRAIRQAPSTPDGRGNRHSRSPRSSRKKSRCVPRASRVCGDSDWRGIFRIARSASATPASRSSRAPRIHQNSSRACCSSPPARSRCRTDSAPIPSRCASR